MTTKLMFTAFVLVAVLEASVAPSQITFSPGPGKTIAQTLAGFGVADDNDSLMAALKSSGELVQSLAAAELADKHMSEAIPYMISAFDKDTQSVPRFNLAQAVFQLDPTQGKKMIVGLCQSSGTQESIRLSATSILENAGIHDCDANIYSIALRSEDPSTKLIALNLLKTGKVVSRDNHVCFDVEAKLLNDENDSVRVSAGSALKIGGYPGSQATIKRRLLVERNQEVARALRRLIDLPTPAGNN